jgi:hypothetical protein
LLGVLLECLEGKLGEDYMKARSYFIEHLAFDLWVKFMRGPVTQFDYVMEMKLNEEVIDYNFQLYQ